VTGFIALCLAVIPSFGFGVEIAVPSAEEMLRASNVVVVGRFDDAGGSFVVEEVLKGPESTAPLHVISPYPKYIFDLERYETDLKGSKVVLVGRLGSGDASFIPFYGACSLWPQGTPKGLLPYDTVADLIPYIRAELQKTSGLPSPSETVSSSPISKANAALSPTVGLSPGSIPPRQNTSPQSSNTRFQNEKKATVTTSKSGFPKVIWITLSALGIITLVWILGRRR
jgi:hypothetical protein